MVKLLIIAVVSGLALALAYPSVGWWPLSAVALMPLFTIIVLRRDSLRWRQVFLIAYVFAVVWYISTIWWIGHVTLPGMLALALFLASLCAGLLTLGWWLVRTGLPPVLAFSAVWMVYEGLVTYLMTGFPWLLLGYSWRPWIAMIQVADIGGVYAVSFLIVLINAALAQSYVGLIERRSFLGRQWGMMLALAIYCAYSMYGNWRIITLGNEQPIKTIRVACIQANIPSLVKHDLTKDSEILDKHTRMSIDAARDKPDVIIWSETAVPGYFQEKLLAYKAMTNVVRTTRIPLLTGLPSYVLDRHNEPIYYNSAGIIEPGGLLVGRKYDKMHLVPFGEFVPCESWLPFLKKLTPIAGSFSPGADVHGLDLITPRVSVTFGPLICFEDVFGYLARAMARIDVDILVNFTNDGWFRNSPGAYQHVAISAFRAVETRKPLIRATNSGVSAVIDRLGYMRTVFSLDGHCTEVSGIMRDEVPVHEPIRTIYAQFGDWFLVAWLVVTCAAVARGLLRPRQ